VWGWGYGGEGQLGLGSRIRTVSSPHPVPCIESALYSKDRPSAMKGNKAAEEHVSKVLGNCVRAIACGGRHSAVVTGQLYIFSLFLLVITMFMSRHPCHSGSQGSLKS
jgi:hypothetical protein